MTRQLNNSLLEIKMWCHFSSERQVINFTRPLGRRRYFSVEQKEKSLTKQACPYLLTPAPMAYNDLIQEVYDSLVSSCSLSTTMVCLSKCTVGFSLAMKNRQQMHAVQTVSLLLILCEKYVATRRKSDLESTQNTSYNKLHLLLIIIWKHKMLYFRLLFISASFETNFSILNEQQRQGRIFQFIIKCWPISLFSNITWPWNDSGSESFYDFCIMEVRGWKARCFAEQPQRHMACFSMWWPALLS